MLFITWKALRSSDKEKEKPYISEKLYKMMRCNIIVSDGVLETLSLVL